MKKSMFYLETHSTDPYYNLAFEEYILQNHMEGDFLLLWQNENTIVVGQNQNTEAEINHAFVKAHGIHVVRRTTGGGAVYHDLGNLNYSFITDAGNTEELTMERFTKPVVQALREMGLEAEASGRNDILVSGKKVSGTAQRLWKHRILHHGTLLFDSNPAMVAGALQVDPSKFQSKGAKSVQSRIGNIREYLKEDMELADFWAYLKKNLSRDGAEPLTLSAEEMQAIAQLKKEKYDTWEWNFGRSPQYTMSNKNRFDGGILEVRVSVEKGMVSEITFFGDFLSLRDLSPLCDALQGVPFRQEDFAEILQRYPLHEYFGSITLEEILYTLFDV